MTPAELVERVMALGSKRLAETLELLHPDAVVLVYWQLALGLRPRAYLSS